MQVRIIERKSVTVTKGDRWYTVAVHRTLSGGDNRVQSDVYYDLTREEAFDLAEVVGSTAPNAGDSIWMTPAGWVLQPELWD